MWRAALPALLALAFVVSARGHTQGVVQRAMVKDLHEDDTEVAQSVIDALERRLLDVHLAERDRRELAESATAGKLSKRIIGTIGALASQEIKKHVAAQQKLLAQGKRMTKHTQEMKEARAEISLNKRLNKENMGLKLKLEAQASGHRVGEGDSQGYGDNDSNGNGGYGSTPTEPPTAASTEPPTAAPTEPPIAAPTEPPIAAPTEPPTAAPISAAVSDFLATVSFETEPPTAAPTEPPTEAPTKAPTEAPTLAPTAPTLAPTAAPTAATGCRGSDGLQKEIEELRMQLASERNSFERVLSGKNESAAKQGAMRSTDETKCPTCKECPMPAPTAPIDVTAPAMSQGAGVASGETAPALTVSHGFNWTQCRSEGGDKDCALCDDAGGAMPCNVTGELRDDGVNSTECPDDKIFTTGKFWRFINPVKHKGPEVKGTCLDLTTRSTQFGSALYAWDTEEKVFPGGSREIMVVTKAWVTHPDLASRNVSVLMFKRIVAHECTNNLNTTCADVHKMSQCIQCPYPVFGENPSQISNEFHQSDGQRKLFLEDCFPKAINASTGQIKTNYTCSGDDQDKAKASLAVF